MNHKTVLRFVALVLVFTMLGSGYAQDPVEILYWDQVSSDDAQAVIDTIVANFEEAHPNIKITREVYTLEQLTDIARTAIEAGEGPDILYYDSGPAYGGILGNAGLLLSLEEAYATYNWDERLVSVSRDWTTYGGTVYGVGHEFEAQGFYWNKRIFADEGLEVPATFEELVALCGTFRELGYDPPMAAGWADWGGFPISHNWYNVLANSVPSDKVAAAISGEYPFNSPDIVASLDLVVELIEADCYDEQGAATSFLDGNAKFYTGQAPMMLMSTWAMQFFTDEITDEFGFMIMPPIEGGEQTMIQLMGAVWYIIGDTEHPEETLTFLNYLVSDEAHSLWVEGAKLLPGVTGVDFSDYDVRPVYRDFLNLVSGWDGPVGYHLDVLTPANFNTTLFESNVELAAGRLTSQEVADRITVEMERAVEDGRHADITG